jgi:hypothetical protein
MIPVVVPKTIEKEEEEVNEASHPSNNIVQRRVDLDLSRSLPSAVNDSSSTQVSPKLITDGEKPPAPFPYTYWTRRNEGWILEYRKRVSRTNKYDYDYYGILPLNTWDQLKGKYSNEKIKEILRGIIATKREELESNRSFKPRKNSRRTGARRK